MGRHTVSLNSDDCRDSFAMISLGLLCAFVCADIRAMLKDCLNSLLHELPEEPLPYIQNYFNSKGDGSASPTASAAAAAEEEGRPATATEGADEALMRAARAGCPATAAARAAAASAAARRGRPSGRARGGRS